VGIRLIGLPIKTVSKSVSKVFYQKLNTTLLQKKDCTELIYKVSLGLSILSVLPMLLILIWGPDLFSAILGSEWREAGVYSRILIPMYWTRFVTASVESHLVTFERQDLVMKWNMLYFIMTFLSLTVGSLSGNIRVALLLYSLSAMACYAMHLFLGLQASKRLFGQNIFIDKE